PSATLTSPTRASRELLALAGTLTVTAGPPLTDSPNEVGPLSRPFAGAGAVPATSGNVSVSLMVSLNATVPSALNVWSPSTSSTSTALSLTSLVPGPLPPK